MPRTKLQPRWASPAEAAAYAGVHPRTIGRRIIDGSLPARRFGPRLLRIDLNDVDRLFRPVPAVSNGAA